MTAQTNGRSSSDLTDEAWERIALLLPKRKKRGRPRADDRRTLNGILYVLHTGCQWKELPRERYGAYATCANRLRTWKRNGTWARLKATLLRDLDRAGKLNWHSGYLDASTKASKRGAVPRAGTTGTTGLLG